MIAIQASSRPQVRIVHIGIVRFPEGSRGRAFPRWNGNLLVGSLVKQELIRIGVPDNRAVLQEVLIPHIGRIRALAIGPNGEIYVALQLAQQGVVVRLIPKS